MKSFFSNSKYKKGQILSMGFFLVMFLIVFILIIIGTNVFVSEINDDVQLDSDMSQASKDVLNTYDINYSTTWDSMFIFAFCLVWIVLLISAVFIDIQPAFFVIVLLLMVGLLVVAMWIGNSYEEIISDDDLTDYAANYKYANFIMTNLLTVTIVIAFSIVLVMYGKNRFG